MRIKIQLVIEEGDKTTIEDISYLERGRKLHIDDWTTSLGTNDMSDDRKSRFMSIDIVAPLNSYIKLLKRFSLPQSLFQRALIGFLQTTYVGYFGKIIDIRNYPHPNELGEDLDGFLAHIVKTERGLF